MFDHPYPSCCVGSVADDATTLEELIDYCQTELDLWEEGQDGTEEFTAKDIRELRAWLKKYTHPLAG